MTASSKVVVARTLPRAGLALLDERFEVDAGDLAIDRDGLRERVAGAAAIVADPTVPVDDDLLTAAGPALQVVANFAVGYDNVDLDACRSAGVTVTNTPDVLTNATAELTVALMLAAARRLSEGDALVRSGRWTGWEPEQLLGTELSGACVGIVGLGRIGSRVAELLRGFSCDIRYWGRARKPELETSLEAKYRDLGDLEGEADFLTLHLPLNSETHHLIDSTALAHLRKGAILINTSRGGLVDTSALVQALASGRLAAAGLDVYENEPDVADELLRLKNVVLAPHVGSATRRTRDAMARLAAENVIAVLTGGRPPSPVVLASG